MRGFLDSVVGIGFLITFLLGQFPVGTIIMGYSCSSQKLGGLDWVFSVIIPFYGIFRAATC